ncbi:MAG: hypothetical protein F9K35_09880 [Burkholderiaceae bacterium]|nr:MAG: hypothetical protein F9K35_09880 [Burkholderiaceae bacterium]
MSLEQILAGAEEKALAAAEALLATDAVALERSSTMLREAAAELALAVGQQGSQALDAAQAGRVRVLGERLAQVREQLARVVALADRQAATVLPPADAPTYGAPGSTAPRIYRAAG